MLTGLEALLHHNGLAMHRLRYENGVYMLLCLVFAAILYVLNLVL